MAKFKIGDIIVANDKIKTHADQISIESLLDK